MMPHHKNLHGGAYIPGQSQPTADRADETSQHLHQAQTPGHSPRAPNSLGHVPLASAVRVPRQPAIQMESLPSPPYSQQVHLPLSGPQPDLEAARSLTGTSAHSATPLTGGHQSQRQGAGMLAHTIPPDYAKEEREVPKHLAGSCNRCCAGLPCRTKKPRHYLEAKWEYLPPPAPGFGVVSPGPIVFRHRDVDRRTTRKPLTDRYLHHLDGRLRKLIVAASDDIWNMAVAGRNESTWRRTYVRKMAPYSIRLESWVIDGSTTRDCGSYSLELCKTLVYMIGSLFIPFSAPRSRGRWIHEGLYAPVLYKYYGDAKVWNNPLENTRGGILQRHNRQQYVYRALKPRHLCFLRDAEQGGIDVWSVDEWEASEARAGRSPPSLRYLFVAYATEQFNHSSAADLDALHRIAQVAARQAGVQAYWVACSCMRNPEELESDVYRIADVVRGAEAMVIALGYPTTGATPNVTGIDSGTLLAQWGQRMWTFPEVLLSPGDRIAVYLRGNEDKAEKVEPFWINKSQFASQVWDDASEARQLIDHYLGTCVLSRLELAVLGLRCLYRRAATQYLPGDQAYALMGLLRLRPEVDKTDSPFQAFSRLSLANDSDCLLERYLCMLPPAGEEAAWHYMADAYGCLSWDVAPYVQVAGVCDNDSVILDGAYGASVRWKSFYPVGYTKFSSRRRKVAFFLVRFNGFILAAGGYLFTTQLIIGVFVVLMGVVIFFCTPWLIRQHLGGKFRNVEAALLGVEGYMSPATAERTLFGCAYGRMSWSTSGSPLSRSYLNSHGELVGVNPLRDPRVAEKVELAKVAIPGSKRIFTLIDTYSMEVTLFEATRPPTCFFLCASEGGMQRAIGCSYDFPSQTFYRETVLRMPSTVINRMSRMPRFRIGIRKPEVQVRRIGS